MGRLDWTVINYDDTVFVMVRQRCPATIGQKVHSTTFTVNLAEGVQCEHVDANVLGKDLFIADWTAPGGMQRALIEGKVGVGIKALYVLAAGTAAWDMNPPLRNWADKGHLQILHNGLVCYGEMGFHKCCCVLPSHGVCCTFIKRGQQFVLKDFHSFNGTHCHLLRYEFIPNGHAVLHSTVDNRKDVHHCEWQAMVCPAV